MPTTRPSVMKYVVPPIVIPVLLFIGIVAYAIAMLRPPITDAPSSHSRRDLADSVAQRRPPPNREDVV
jgi:hypothetical protein